MLTRWKKEYMATSHKVILAETLSPTFVGLTFQVIIIAAVILTLIFNKKSYHDLLYTIHYLNYPYTSPSLKEVAEICYLRLNLVLVAMEVSKHHNHLESRKSQRLSFGFGIFGFGKKSRSLS